MLAHADAVAGILQHIGGSQAMQAASYLVYACDHLNKPHEVISQSVWQQLCRRWPWRPPSWCACSAMARLAQVSVSRGTPIPMAQTAAAQTESVRKMLLAFSRDLRVVMLRLASRLQTLRHFAATKLPVPPGLASEALQVFAPLANRLGIWEIKWEMEDLSFRFLEPDTYREVAGCWMKSVWSAKPSVGAARHGWQQDLRARASRHRAGAAQAHLQHRQKDARQVAGLRSGV
jgi:GTP pyrophosphokinase